MQDKPGRLPTLRGASYRAVPSAVKATSGKRSIETQGAVEGANCTPERPISGCDRHSDQRALHTGARKQDYLIFKSLNHSQQRPQFLFDPSYFPQD